MAAYQSALLVFFRFFVSRPLSIGKLCDCKSGNLSVCAAKLGVFDGQTVRSHCVWMSEARGICIFAGVFGDEKSLAGKD